MSSAELFRQAFRRHATTVAVLTYLDDAGAPVGMTATSMCSLSAEPPTLLVCINRENRAHPEISGRGVFGVNLLAVSQRPIALHCSVVGRDKHLRPQWLAPDTGDGTPRLADSLAHLECTVDRSYEAWSHTIIIGLIRSVWLNPLDAPPLLYHGGIYNQLESAAERTERFHWEMGDE
jgi:flavin reductase (DIM6/NTAB) family NADH-FMN oxidoreductase RutF